MSPSKAKPRQPDREPKPYEFVTFPAKPPQLKAPAGHDRYHQNRVHGTVELELTVGTGLHVSTGATLLGSDVGQSRIPLIKTMQMGEQKLSIPGSSLKGVVRSIYEAITNSTLAVVTPKYKDRLPKERLPCRKRDKLCPASQIFGALDWQGLVTFRDAICVQSGFAPGFMPSLYRPRADQRDDYFKPVARKFYYHAAKAVTAVQRGIPVQQASAQYVFKTDLQIQNLSQAEVGTLFVALGQDPQYPFALKIGAGKPIGMGSVMVKIKGMDKPESIEQRYRDYDDSSTQLTGDALEKFMTETIATAHRQKLIELTQLQQLQRILCYPTDRSAPTGMY